MPFRHAHQVTGELVRLAEGKGCRCRTCRSTTCRGWSRASTTGISVLGVDQSVASRTSFGGTAPDNVRRAIQDARGRFK